jgi:predicted AAA+ superfamily ATPase
LHQLLGIRTEAELVRHPKMGASWEGHVVDTLMRSLRPDEAYFWATHQGAELDLLLFHRGKRYGVEIKRADAPALTPSMRIAMSDLKLDHLAVIYPGDVRYSIAKRVAAIPASSLASVSWATLQA